MPQTTIFMPNLRVVEIILETILDIEVCKKIRFDFRSDIGLRRMSNIRHPKPASSDVGFSTFEYGS